MILCKNVVDGITINKSEINLLKVINIIKITLKGRLNTNNLF